MDLKEIKQLIRLVDEKKFAEFELEQGDFRLRIKRNEVPIIQHAGESLTVEPEPISTSDHDAEHSLTAVASAATPAIDEEAVETDLHVVTSPIVGTFYRAPSPTADPFVREGDWVEPGTILCIVEAMKIMNEIPSDVAGQVVKIHVENAQPVEYGQPLLSIKVGRP